MDIRSNVLAILVAGSPAPGINSVISAVAIEALNNGFDVIGIKWGFKRIILGQTQGCTVSLNYQHVSTIHSQPGSILFTSKRQLSTSQEVDNVLRSLEYLRIRYLVTIGGVETAYSSHLLYQAASAAGMELSIAHTPKTVYNDLPMPPECITFGFTTARDTGVALCQNYKVDARTLGRWYIISVIGQRAGHLAEGIGKGAAATLTLIPEEFVKGEVDMNKILDIIESTMIKRLALSRDYGVIILAEGIIDKLPDTEIRSLFGSVAEGYGMFSKTVREKIVERLSRKGISLTVCSSAIGSEIRSAPPNSTDINLARDLGYGAARYLLQGGSGQTVCLKGSSIVTYDLDLHKLSDCGEHPIRLVDTTSGSYEVAFKYQIRLKQTDLQDAELLKNMASICNMDDSSFVQQFKHVAF